MRIRKQLGAHHRVEVVRTESERDVLCFWLIANTFHILEVLNDRCVSRLTKTVPVLSDDKVIQAPFCEQADPGWPVGGGIRAGATCAHPTDHPGGV